jgi:hypothetical protein
MKRHPAEQGWTIKKPLHHNRSYIVAFQVSIGQNPQAASVSVFVRDFNIFIPVASKPLCVGT